MDKKILDFLAKNRVCTLTVTLPDGNLHSAAMHYSHRDDPLMLFFSTDKSSRKCEGLLGGQTVKAAVVVGWSEDDWVTLQMDGEIKAISDPLQIKAAQEIHYQKHPDSAKYKDDPGSVFLVFTPTWDRFTG